MRSTQDEIQFIDSHCHLYSEQFDADRQEMMENAAAAGVARFYMPAIDSNTHDAMLATQQQYPQAKAMMGLHPCSVAANYKSELQIVVEWLSKRSFAAVGEIGLDYYWSTEFMEEQMEAFTLQMQWALDRKMPIVIHTRNAMQPTIDAVQPFAAKGLRGIFHCFGGAASEAEAIVNMGFLLGIGGVLTYKKSTLPEAFCNIALEHLVLETDAPYLPPTPHRGKRNESSYLPLVAAKLAEVKGVTIAEIAAITTANAEKIFKV